LFGLTVPSEEGGAGLDPVATITVIEELSRADPGFGLSYLAHEVLFVHNFFNSGSPAQRKRYLSKVLSGEWIAGMAMTEPEVGTDVLGMKTVAVRKGDRYILNGTKQFITNGPYGSLFLVYAKIDDSKRRDISAFLVESKYKGFSVGKKESKMGMRSSPTSCLVFEDCEVPAENLVGEEGRATVHMMRNLEIERVSLSAQSTGICLRCVEEMNRYAISLRKSFGKPLIEYGQMQRLVAESYAESEAARTFVYHVAHQINPRERHSLGAASAKMVAPAAGERVARNAIQVMGGYGYCREYPVERMLRDAILLSIGGGTNEAMQKNIAKDLQKEYA
jgi:isovaleryl-CoA dehydrogenase